MTEDRLRARRGGRKREGAAKADYVVWFALRGDLEERLDRVRGEMPRAVWLRTAFLAQLTADERNGTAGGLPTDQNPYDGGMPFGLPLPDPHEGGRKAVPKRTNKHNQGRAEVSVAAELRHIQVISLRQAGKSFEEIAEITGYTPGTARWIIRHDLNKYKMATVQEYREFTLRKLLELMQTQQDTIDKPGYVTDVKGALVMGPDGEWLIDKGERTRAVTEQRKLIESIRREVGTDAPSTRHVTLEETQLNNTLKGLLAALAIAKPAGALENAVDAEILSDSDEEGSGEGDEAGWESPGKVPGDDPAGGESGQQEEQDGGHEQEDLHEHDDAPSGLDQTRPDGASGNQAQA